jgi:hypothetical protein
VQEHRPFFLELSLTASSLSRQLSLPRRHGSLRGQKLQAARIPLLWPPTWREAQLQTSEPASASAPTGSKRLPHEDG